MHAWMRNLPTQSSATQPITGWSEPTLAADPPTHATAPAAPPSCSTMTQVDTVLFGVPVGRR